MVKSEEKRQQTDLDSLKADMQDYIDDAVRRETRSLKMLVQTALDALEFYQKSVNLRFGALTGHETKKAKEKEIVLETGSLEEAIATAREIQKKKSAATAPHS